MAATASIIALLASVGASVANGIITSKKNNEANQARQAGIKKAVDWYKGQYALDNINLPAVQAMRTQQKELLADSYKKARATNAIAGGTDESIALMQDSANQAMAQSNIGITKALADRKDKIAGQIASLEMGQGDTQAQFLENQAKNIANATEGVSKASGSLIDADGGDWGWLMSKKK